MTDKLIDCAIVGGGPAGLTAAIYLARFHLDVKVVDAGNSRATWIPVSHNHAGFPEGIPGRDLVARMADQARLYGASIEKNRVTRIDVDPAREGATAPLHVLCRLRPHGGSGAVGTDAAADRKWGYRH